MALSYTLRQPLESSGERSSERLVLITGAAGNIGSYFAKENRGRYRLRLMLRDDDERKEPEGFGEVVTGDLTNLERMKELCGGVDTVLHRGEREPVIHVG